MAVVPSYYEVLNGWGLLILLICYIQISMSAHLNSNVSWKLPGIKYSYIRNAIFLNPDMLTTVDEFSHNFEFTLCLLQEMSTCIR
jgi:hypothetical protein